MDGVKAHEQAVVTQGFFAQASDASPDAPPDAPPDRDADTAADTDADAAAAADADADADANADADADAAANALALSHYTPLFALLRAQPMEVSKCWVRGALAEGYDPARRSPPVKLIAALILTRCLPISLMSWCSWRSWRSWRSWWRRR